MGILDDAIREHLELKRRHGASDDEVARQEAEALGPARRDTGAGAAPADEPEPADDRGATALESAPPPDPGAAVGRDEGAPPRPEAVEPLHAEPSPLDPLEPPAAAAPVEDAPDDPFPATEAMPAAELPDDPFETAERRGPGGSVPAGATGDALADREPAVPAVPAEPNEPVEPIEAEAAEEILPPDEAAADAEPDDPLAPLDEPTRVRPLPPIDDDSLPPEPSVPAASPDDDEPPHDDDATMVRPAPVDDPLAPEPGKDDVLEETPDFLQDTPEHDRLWFEQRPPRDFDFDD